MCLLDLYLWGRRGLDGGGLLELHVTFLGDCSPKVQGKMGCQSKQEILYE